MRFEKLVRELVLTSSPSAIGPFWAAKASWVSSFPPPAASSRPTHLPRSRAPTLRLWLELPWWQAPVLPANTLPARPDPRGWAAVAASPQLAFHKTQDWGAMAFEQPRLSPSCCPRQPRWWWLGDTPTGNSITAASRTTDLFLFLLCCACKKHFSTAKKPRGSCAVLPSSPSLFSFPCLHFQPFSGFPPAPLKSPSPSLPSPSLFPTDGWEPPACPIKPDTLGNSCLLSATCSWFYLPPGDGFHKAAVSAEVRRLPALALTCIPALKIMDTMENQWRICNFIPFIASYCITPWPSDT